jgi:5-(carboxyamino)imidazole ribonucleotide synthase
MARIPLGSTDLTQSTIMLNILGDEWLVDGQQSEPLWNEILKQAKTKLHLYGKAEPRRGRKMGHINFVGSTPSEVKLACENAVKVLRITR